MGHSENQIPYCKPRLRCTVHIRFEAKLTKKEAKSFALQRSRVPALLASPREQTVDLACETEKKLEKNSAKSEAKLNLPEKLGNTRRWYQKKGLKVAA
jgi:hypothetical protein